MSPRGLQIGAFGPKRCFLVTMMKDYFYQELSMGIYFQSIGNQGCHMGYTPDFYPISPCLTPAWGNLHIKIKKTKMTSAIMQKPINMLR